MCIEQNCCSAVSLIGTKLADISLKVFQGNEFRDVNMKDFRGKWLVLFFYPADFTLVCPTELGALADLYEEFRREGAEVMSVSNDTVFVHKAWHDSSPSIGKIKFPMGADPTADLSRHLGVYLPEEGVSLRGSFIIDPEGIIQAYEVHGNSIGRNINELLRKLQAAKFCLEHGAEACPVNWQPGAKTLKPGIDLVGKL